MKYQISYKETPEGELQGFVNGHRCISIAYTKVTQLSPKKDWIIQSSSCLPTELEWAKAYLEAMGNVIKRAEAKRDGKEND